MAVFDGDEDLISRVGVFSPLFNHFGLKSFSSIGAEVLCLNSGFEMNLKTKIGMLVMERDNPEMISLMFVNQSYSKCLEQILQVLQILYRRLMTIETEEPSNFVDIACALVPELRYTRTRDTRNPKNPTKKAIHQPSIKINIQDTDEISKFNMRRRVAITAGLERLYSTHSANLSPTMNVVSSIAKTFVSGTDYSTVILVTPAEIKEIAKKRIASNRLEEVLLRSNVIEPLNYRKIGIDHFSPMNRLKLVAANATPKKKAAINIFPDPESINLLNIQIPSDTLREIYDDYGVIKVFEKMLPERQSDSNRIPLGLSVNEYLMILE
ncbi:hypothetical protein HK100_003332, partial [Physocladia obscura]